MEHEDPVSGPTNRFELLVQSVTDYAIYMLDPGGVITSWNAGAERFKGYTAEEIIGRHFSSFYTEEDLAAGIPETGLRTAAAQGRFEAEGWRIRKDGTRFWANVVIDPIFEPGTAELLGFAKVTRDLTARRLADEELRRSEERFRLLLQSVTDYAIYMLDAEGYVTSWNAGAQRFKGYTAEEIIGEHFSRFYGPEDREAGVPARALRTALEEGRFEAEGLRYRKDGTAFWASVVIDPVRNDEGQLIGFAKITRDLTERREAQLALEQTQQAFVQSQKMEAIGQLTGGVAHDFNNLLAAIMSSVELARRRYSEGRDISQFLDNIMQATERGATLTHRMLAFARKQELELQSVDVPEVVRGMADLLQRTLGPAVTIDTKFPLSLDRVRADPAQLELAILNLVVNARDAMAGEGLITISARSLAGDGPLGGPCVCLWVKDQGQGMDAETVARATDPFFTTKGIGKGTGLGLSMVQGMAEQCGGRFVIQSEKGVGTTAEIWLPVAEAEEVAAGPVAVAATVLRWTSSLKILVVDDDEIVLLNTAAMLAEMGHDVLRAHSALEALALLDQTAVDLLIADYAMPGMNGGELIATARASHPGLSALLMSGFADVPEGVSVAPQRLAKPFNAQQLASAVADAVAGGKQGDPE